MNLQRSLCAGGHIYKDSYSGWYCVSDEAFLADDQVADSPELGSKVAREKGGRVEASVTQRYAALCLGVTGERAPSGVGV